MVDLPIEGHLPGFDGATGWLYSAPLTAADMRGKVVLVFLDRHLHQLALHAWPCLVNARCVAAGQTWAVPRPPHRDSSGLARAGSARPKPAGATAHRNKWRQAGLRLVRSSGRVRAQSDQGENPSRALVAARARGRGGGRAGLCEEKGTAAADVRFVRGITQPTARRRAGVAAKVARGGIGRGLPSPSLCSPPCRSPGAVIKDVSIRPEGEPNV